MKMAATVPNQKVVHVNRQKCEKNFLQISKENWYAANKALSPYPYFSIRFIW